MVIFIIQISIIVDEHLAAHHFFNDRMSAAFDADHAPGIDGRTNIITVAGDLGKRDKYIKLSHCLCCFLNADDGIGDRIPDFAG